MRRLIAAINMTLDGYCDHTAMKADDELHWHYTNLLRSAGTLVYGRITYQLMESYWPQVVKNPTGNAANDEFAKTIDELPKVVFSRTLKKTDWHSARIATGSLEDEVRALKQKDGRDILVGSPSLIVQTLKLGLVDELQLAVQPIIASSGLPLFKNISERIDLQLLRKETLAGTGAVVMYVKPVT